MFLVLLEAAVLVADERRSPQIIFYKYYFWRSFSECNCFRGGQSQFLQERAKWTSGWLVSDKVCWATKFAPKKVCCLRFLLARSLSQFQCAAMPLDAVSFAVWTKAKNSQNDSCHAAFWKLQFQTYFKFKKELTNWQTYREEAFSSFFPEILRQARRTILIDPALVLDHDECWYSSLIPTTQQWWWTQYITAN